MAKTPDGNTGAMNGTSEVVLVDDPASGEQNYFTGARFANPDTVEHTITVYLKDASANLIQIGQALVLPAGTPGTTFTVDGMDTVQDGQSVVAKMAAPHTTTAPRYWSSWINCTTA